MSWFYGLHVLWMSVVVLAAVAAANGIIYYAVFILATPKRTIAFKLMSPVMLTPLAVVFGLIIGFLAAQVWSDTERANVAVTREAGALDTVVLLAASFPETGKQIRALVRRHIEEAVTREWPAMARQETTLAMMTAADREGHRAHAVDAAANQRTDDRAACDGGGVPDGARRTPRAHHHQPIEDQLGEMDRRAGARRPHRHDDRHHSLRQPLDRRVGDGPLFDRNRRLCRADCIAQPPVHR
jgi:hypothetical protein